MFPFSCMLIFEISPFPFSLFPFPFSLFLFPFSLFPFAGLQTFRQAGSRLSAEYFTVVVLPEAPPYIFFETVQREFSFCMNPVLQHFVDALFLDWEVLLSDFVDA